MNGYHLSGIITLDKRTEGGHCAQVAAAFFVDWKCARAAPAYSKLPVLAIACAGRFAPMTWVDCPSRLLDHVLLPDDPLCHSKFLMKSN